MIIEVETQPVAEIFSGGVELIERLADEWRELCAEGPCDQPFFRPEWIAAYTRAFVPQKKLLLLTVRVDGRLRAVLPLVEGWELLHGLPVRKLCGAANWHSCRFDLVHGAEVDLRATTSAIWQLLKQRRGWDLIELRNVPRGGAGERLLSIAQSDGYLTGQWELPPAPYLAGTDVEKALDQTNAKFRNSLRRKRRRLEEEGEIQFKSTTKADRSELERFYQLERSGWKGRKGTAIACNTLTQQFYDEVARVAAEFGYLSLFALECGSRAVAMQFCLTYGRRCYLLKPAYDEQFSQYSPGHLITYEILRSADARGLTEYDFLPPQSEWKSRWAKAARGQSSCLIFRPGIAGRALCFWKFGVMQKARQLKRRLSGSQGF